MSSVINIYIVRAERLAVDATNPAPDYMRTAAALDETMRNRNQLIATWGARWAQLELDLITFFDQMDIIDALLPAPCLLHQCGVVSVDDTAAIAAQLAAASPELIEKMEPNVHLASVYWSLRDTFVEAARRHACVAIQI